MKSTGSIRARAGAALLAGALVLAAPFPAAAQAGEDAAAALARHLRALAEEPKSLGALMGAGKAALEVGDPQAAITFFARAEEQAPRDWRIKAGYGSAFLAMEQPVSALKFFGEAAALGAPEAEIAGERGLAYDLNGDPRRAQADYQTALRRRDDPEVRRHLALSLAISGDREAALAAIQPQIQRQDRAAWRTRAFVLALTGDAAGATQAVQAVMPAQAAAMRPFLARLPQLSPAQRALAVHYGTMPAQGTAYAAAEPAYTPPSSFAASVTDAGRPDGRQPALTPRRAAPEPVSTAPRRRPGSETSAQAAPAPKPQRSAAREGRERREYGVPLGAQTRRVTVREPVRAAPRPQRTELAAAVPVRTTPVATPAPAPTPAPVGATPAPAPAPAPQPVFQTPAPAPAATPAPEPQVVTTALPASSAAPESLVPAVLTAGLAPASESARPGFDLGAPSASADAGFEAIAELVEKLPEAAPEPAPAPAIRLAEAKPAPRPEPKPAAAKAEEKPPVKLAEAKRPEPKKPEPKKKAEPAKPKAPSRHWVQIAGGADKAALPREFQRLKGKAPDLLASQAAWTTPLRFTNRLLVGPFKSDDEAQELVNALNKLDFGAFSWKSPEGQEIEKLPAK